MSTTSTNFYVQKPQDVHWNVGMHPNYVIEAGPIDLADSELYDFQKTDEFVRDYLKVIKPKPWGWLTVKKSMFLECSGPVRKLEIKEYIELVHSLLPERPLPKYWQEMSKGWSEI